MSSRLRIAILGSTGSIGRQALDVASRFPELIEVVALAAGRNAAALGQQASHFNVKHVAIAEPALEAGLASALPDAEVTSGAGAVVELATLPEVDLVLNALVGAAGLRASVATLKTRKRLALANKESLVVGGELVMALATYPNAIIPVDSEHSAIFQCLLGEPAESVSRIWLTASGGPFRGRDRASLASVTVAEALAHPRWTMGPKITIDSSTLMNKGLEAIEARHLFGVGYDTIKIVVHPQSCIHSMVEFADGSVKAHLGATDMRIPIQYALSHPDRWGAPVPPVDFATLGTLDFEEPDYDAFPALTLALEAGRIAGTMPTAMNAANEVAVAAFLSGETGFMDIPRTVEAVMGAHDLQALESIEQVEAVDEWARAKARETL
ncbi:MAG: 1-deoxy-D-xylulose-5-phosphate reductoisomerase [Actinobacteria bacterium HGW-Actinobacteria-6]|jgi:1-deoxy-D-xylulose-5-phosphate reductoisomerase|nr:MAG: 1-deoxy-D-xylulose-5-phosphate reductoisomerase [Actinobacteria bacterium HGW-Actinobacteria-6]